METRPTLVSEVPARPEPAGPGSVCGRGYERQGAANSAGPDKDVASVITEHLCAPSRRQHAGNLESASVVNSRGATNELQKSASKKTAAPARVTRSTSADVLSPMARKNSGYLSQNFWIYPRNTKLSEEECWRAALLTRGAKHHTTMRIAWRGMKMAAYDRNGSDWEGFEQSRIGKGCDSTTFREEATFGSLNRRTVFRDRHRAMVLSSAATTRGQFRFRIGGKNGRIYQRQTEKSQQRYGQYPTHVVMIQPQQTRSQDGEAELI